VRRVGFMITHLRAQNFKSWKDTGDLCLGRLTGLFGTNSSGKTSILQILPLLKQTAEFQDRNRVLYTGKDDSPVYLGTFQEIIHGHQPDAALTLSFTWRQTEPLSLLYLGTPSDEILQILHEPEFSFRTSIARRGEGPVVDSFEYELGQQVFGMRRNDDGTYMLIHRPGNLTTGGLGLDLRSLFPIGTDPNLEKIPFGPPVKCYGFPPEAGVYFGKLTGPRNRRRSNQLKEHEVGHPEYPGLPELELAFESLFGRMHYLGPIRSYPQRVYEWGGEKPLDTGWDGDETISALLASKTVTQVAAWLKDMGLIHSFRLQPVGESRTIYQCHVKTTESATEVLLPDVGFGVSQILPVLANCAMLPDGSTLLLEQPEIHLHPFAQAALADVLIDAITKRNLRIIVESHSEHLLRRIQRRIARGVLKAEDTALYFCHLENGTSAIEELDVDSYGNIRNWPKNFFGDEMGELADMTVAAMERQKAGRK
jgi:predicted ATPase